MILFMYIDNNNNIINNLEPSKCWNWLNKAKGNIWVLWGCLRFFETVLEPFWIANQFQRLPTNPLRIPGGSRGNPKDSWEGVPQEPKAFFRNFLWNLCNPWGLVGVPFPSLGSFPFWILILISGLPWLPMVPLNPFFRICKVLIASVLVTPRSLLLTSVHGSLWVIPL